VICNLLDKRNEPGWADQRDRNCNCNGVGQSIEGCCSGSRLRDEGIKRRTGRPGVYFADADLECATIFCRGRDAEILYEWSLTPISGNPRILPPSRSFGYNEVEVAGTGTFDLHVRVRFSCEVFTPSVQPFFVRCFREATVRFTQ
jgi:hypothetical protein